MHDEKTKVFPLPVRLVILALLCAGGFVFPVLLVPAAMYALALVEPFFNPRPAGLPPPEPPLRLTVTADDPKWKVYFLEFCESPAETAFLEAMIAAYGLVPDKGLLKGSGLSLSLQVKEPPYRMDFLADGWLVIEIDGAAFHSSPEAIANDRVRDEFLRSKGYTVIRIPAKVVFNDAPEAVRRVRAALTEGRQPKAALAPNETSSGPMGSLRKSLTSAKNFIEDVNRGFAEIDRSVTRARALEKAIAASRSAFTTETSVITAVLKDAESSIELEAFLGQNEERAKLYQAAKRSIDAAIERELQESGDLDRPDTIPSTIPAFTAPPVHDDAEINEAIQRAFRRLLEDRAKLYKDARRRLQADPRLPEKVRARLEKMGCGAWWDALSQPPPSESRAGKQTLNVVARSPPQPPKTITGSVTIRSVEDWQTLVDSACTAITGDLRIEGNNGVLPQLPGDAPIVTIGGQLLILDWKAEQATLSLPVLSSVGGDLEISNTYLANVHFPELATVGGRLHCVWNYVLTALFLPSLTEVGGLVIEYDEEMTNLSLPVLTNVNLGVDLWGHSKLVTVSLPLLTRVGEHLSVRGNGKLTTLSLPALCELGDLSVFENEALTTLRLPALTKLDSSYFRSNPALQSRHVPALAMSEVA